MKHFYIVAIAGAVSLAACQSAPKADEAKTEDQKEVAAAEGSTYKIAPDQVVNFIGTKPVGEHSGAFTITEGTISVSNDTNITGGKLTLDVNSLKITDKDTAGSSKLAGHLASPDFFDAAQFPTATFEITSVAPYTADSTTKLILDGATHTIGGNLTLKGVTKNVTFPAIITTSADAVTAKANFNINRTDWGLVYGNDQSLGDKFIRPEVNVNFEITARK